MILKWFSDYFIEIFGAVTGIVYVFLEIRQNLWLWPVGIITSGVYIWVFFTGKFYADMSLQGYYLLISVFGWYWWIRGKKGGAGGGVRKITEGPADEGHKDAGNQQLRVSRVKVKTVFVLFAVFLLLYIVMWFVLARFTDSPVPAGDSFITSLSIVATWMLARKIYEHWYLWIVVNTASVIMFSVKGLYPTVILYIVYCVMSFAGLKEWRLSLNQEIN